MSARDGQGDALWAEPPATLSLGRGEVHVWRAELDRPDVEVNGLSALLDAAERGRAARFVFERHRRRFAAARGVLRLLLARYLSLDPAAVDFEYNEYGKPSLKARGAALHFNASHSEGLALYAFSAEAEVGVDVEHFRPGTATAEIAERFFSPAEVRAFRGLPEEARAAAFFNCWARKEAYIKALGRGLSHPLERFTVSLAPGAPAALLADETDPSAAGRWTLEVLPVGEGCAAALAVGRRGVSLRRYAWDAGTFRPARP